MPPIAKPTSRGRWLLTSLLIALGGSKAAAGFITASIYPAGISPSSVAVGDVNGDGVPDLVVANFYRALGQTGTVSLLLGNGDGSFKTAKQVPAGSLPDSVAVGDFNGDGYLDLVAANSVDGTVTVLLGNGDGTFQMARSYPAGPEPQFVAVGDFNGDGILDLAVANSNGIDTAGTVTILLGNGDGSFQGPQSFAVGIHPLPLRWQILMATAFWIWRLPISGGLPRITPVR